MKLTLKEARRLERRLQELHISHGLKVRKSISIYTTVEGSDMVDIAIEEFDASVVSMIKMITIRQNLRRQIQKANESSGINQLISDREAGLRIFGIWETITQHGSNYEQLDNVDNTITSRKASAGNGMERYGTDTVEYTPISETQYFTAKDQQRDTQHAIDRLDDKMAGLNANISVTLEPEDEEFLKINKII